MDKGERYAVLTQDDGLEIVCKIIGSDWRRAMYYLKDSEGRSHVAHEKDLNFIYK